MKFKISDKFGPAISKEMIGLFFEDINFAGDGGLYAEMIENRSFEAKDAFGTPGNFYTVDDYGYAWSAYSEGKELPRLQFIGGAPLSEANPHYLRVTASAAGQGFKNKAYDGITLKKGLSYKISFYARPVSYEGSSVRVCVVNNGKIYGEAEVKLKKIAEYMPFADTDEEIPEGEWGEMIRAARESDDGSRVRKNAWTKYETSFTAGENIRGADFVITLDGKGIIEFDLVSMFPGDAIAGIFRKDLFQALDSIHPGFIRFPGGCIIEGISLENRYRWKNTVGDIKDRKYIPNLWAFQDDRFAKGDDVQRPDSHYGQSFGLGFYEYFLLCEMLGAKALPVLNIAAACQFRSTEIVPIDSEEFNEYVQDALDLIEFANGPVTGKWGALRAKMGHPEAFGLTMLGIGNEQWETKYLDFYERYDRFEKAIHDVYPEIRLVGSAGPNVNMKLTDKAWDFYHLREKKKDFCYAMDEHYYVSPQWMYEHVNFYDEYPRSRGVFAGEYAAHPEDKENTLEGALAEAALMTGFEKNADVIRLASYAPLFNRIGHSQWKPDMIWFDDSKVYLSPSYYVQKLFANNLGASVIPMNGQEKEFQKENIYISTSRSGSGEIIIKAVNAGDEDFEFELTDESGASMSGSARLQILQNAGEKTEGMPEPVEVKEETVEFNGKLKLGAKTFSVFTVL